MPRKTRKDYAHNWEQISISIKNRDKWTCQRCKLKFEVGGKVIVLENGKIRRLTVHHKNRNVKDNSGKNLVSLCCACHCKVEFPLIHKEMATLKTQCQVANGQQLFSW